MFTTVNVLTHHPLLDVIMIDLLIPLVNSDYLDVDLEGNHKKLSSYSPCFRVIPFRAGMPREATRLLLTQMCGLKFANYTHNGRNLKC